MTLVDTNVLLDILTDDPNWADWSLRQMDRAATRGIIVINDIVYAEVSVRFPTIAACDAGLQILGVTILATPKAALFHAGKIYQRYRAAGGTRTGVLSDFFIGAHATVADLALLTRDARRYGFYFPTIDLITP